jgi:hypothetical protein
MATSTETTYHYEVAYGLETVASATDEAANHPYIKHAIGCGVIPNETDFVNRVREAVAKGGLDCLTKLRDDKTLSAWDRGWAIHDRMEELKEEIPRELVSEVLSLEKALPEPEAAAKETESDGNNLESTSTSPDSMQKKPLPALPNDVLTFEDSVPTYHADINGKPLPSLPVDRRPSSARVREWPRRFVNSARSLWLAIAPRKKTKDSRASVSLPTVLQPATGTPAAQQTDTSAAEAVRVYLGIQSLPQDMEQVLQGMDWLQSISHSSSGMRWKDIIKDELAALMEDRMREDIARLCDVDSSSVEGNTQAADHLAMCEADRLILRVQPLDGDAKYLTLVRDKSKSPREWRSGLDVNLPLRGGEIESFLQGFNPGNTKVWLIKPNT